MNHIFEENPCEHCIFREKEICSIDNEPFCYALHGKYKLTNNGLNQFQELYDNCKYKGKQKCENCKYYDNTENIFSEKCNIDNHRYHISTSFDCLYLDDDGELSNFGKQVLMSRKL